MRRLPSARFVIVLACVALVAGALGLSAAVGAPPVPQPQQVLVVNPLTQPVPVQGTVNAIMQTPVYEPVVAELKTLHFHRWPGGLESGSRSYFVPQDKYFTITHVSAMANRASGTVYETPYVRLNLRDSTGAVASLTALSLRDTVADYDYAPTTFAGNVPMRATCPPGTSVEANLSVGGQADVEVNAQVTVAGYLSDACPEP